MATETDITEYHKGEYIRILLYTKNRAGAATPNASTHSVVMTVSDTPEGAPIVTYTEASGNITLNNPTTAEYLIEIFEEDQTLLAEGRTYFYNIWNWSNSTPTVQNLQVKGRLVLQNSIEP